MTGPRRSAGPRTSIRVRAALAGGLVLGLGAGLTVASWTDAELTTPTTFRASSFGVQSSLQGATYTTATPVTTSVSGLYPSPTLTTGNGYVSLKVKTVAGSVAGTVALSAAANAGAGLTPVLRYRIVVIAAAASCSATAFTGSPTYAVGNASIYQQVSAARPPTTSLALAANAGSEVQYCIELSIPTTAAQGTYAGTSATVSWTIVGRSS